VTACPADELLALLAEGDLPEPERAPLEAHLGACAGCARVVAELARLVAPSAPGSDQIGRYEVVDALGSGGMGIVVEAWDPLLSRRVAIKVVRPDRRIARERLLAEARALAQLSDPHVLAIHDVIDSERGVCLITELVDGDTAAVWVDRVRPAWPEIRGLYLQVARGLVAAHARGLLHRDVKPANVFVGRDGRARLGDFGLVGDGTTAIGGTAGFMPPEQAAGEAIDVRADEFALAMSMIHALAGKVVPAGTGPEALRALGVPAAVSPVLARAIATRPADRFARISELVAALEASPPKRRAIWLAAASAATATLLTASIAWFARFEGATPSLRVETAAPGPGATTAGATLVPVDAALDAAQAAPSLAPVLASDAPPIERKPARVAAAIVPAPPPVDTPTPVPGERSQAALEHALSRALSDHDAQGCASALAALVAVEPRFADRRAFCELLAGRCQAGLAALQPRLGGAAAAGIANDYCPADGDLPDHRVGRALNQGRQGRSLASCRHRATWVTGLATSSEEAQLYAVNALECFAAIGRCDDAAGQAAVLARLRATTVAAELARVAPGCAH
jgi:hypothetical protein